MDRYERIIADIQRKTESETLRWSATSADRYPDAVLNRHRVLRIFDAEYPVGLKKYKLLFIERRIDIHDDFGDLFESYSYELFVLSDRDRIVLTLYDGVVDRGDLLKLSVLIDEHNDLAKDFFGAFDESGAAQ